MAKIEQKQVVVNEIKEKLEKAASVVMVDARGLTVEQDTALRKQLREAGVDYKVYKNTMVHFAIQGTQFEGLDEYLAGPSTFAFSYEDATTAASILNKVAKDVKELEFKAGVVEGVVYDAAGMKLIADIPSRDVLLSKLLGSFKSPMSSFARVIDQIAKKDGEAAARRIPFPPRCGRQGFILKTDKYYSEVLNNGKIDNRRNHCSCKRAYSFGTE